MLSLSLKKLGGIFVPDGAEGVEAFGKLKAGVYTCKVMEGSATQEEKRRAGQNSTYWAWLTDLQKTNVNEVAGKTKNEWHRIFKADYLVPIYIRDDPGYALMFSSLETVLNELGKVVYENIVDWVVDETSTTQASVGQFCEYLQCIEQFAHSKGVALRTDPGIYKLIFGQTSWG